MKLAMLEACVFQFETEKGRMVELAALERDAEGKRIANIPTDAQHFAVGKCNVLTYGLGHFYQAEIAIDKLALYEPVTRKIDIGQIATPEGATIIFRFLQRFFRYLLAKENCILNKTIHE